MVQRATTTTGGLRAVLRVSVRVLHAELLITVMGSYSALNTAVSVATYAHHGVGRKCPPDPWLGDGPPSRG